MHIVHNLTGIFPFNVMTFIPCSVELDWNRPFWEWNVDTNHCYPVLDWRYCVWSLCTQKVFALKGIMLCKNQIAAKSHKGLDYRINWLDARVKVRGRGGGGLTPSSAVNFLPSLHICIDLYDGDWLQPSHVTLSSWKWCCCLTQIPEERDLSCSGFGYGCLGPQVTAQKFKSAITK